MAWITAVEEVELTSAAALYSKPITGRPRCITVLFHNRGSRQAFRTLFDLGGWLVWSDCMGEVDSSGAVPFSL